MKSLKDICSNYNQKYSFISYILFFFSFSFIGWFWEVMLHLVEDRAFVNRGSMYGPWLPIYGVGGVLILLLLKRYGKRPFTLFIMSSFLCGIIEYFTGWYFETFRHIKYWDYSEFYFNIQGRVCLYGLILFGIGGCVFVYFLAPVLEILFKKINVRIKRILCIVLISIFVIDFIYATFFVPNKGKGITNEIGYVLEMFT